ncbi:hypothetical protein GCM10028798_19580 [Humibacter antri]
MRANLLIWVAPELDRAGAKDRDVALVVADGDVGLGQERGLEPDVRTSFHARQVRSAYSCASAGTSAYLISRDDRETRLTRVSGH